MTENFNGNKYVVENDGEILLTIERVSENNGEVFELISSFLILGYHLYNFPLITIGSVSTVDLILTLEGYWFKYESIGNLVMRTILSSVTSHAALYNKSHHVNGLSIKGYDE